MVQLRPEFIPEDAPKSEKILFEKFKALKGADDWIVLHSLDIFGDVNLGQGEADLVVLIPGSGVLVIEVKGHHDVRQKNGVWTLSGEVKQRGPVKQASNAMYAIMQYLKNNEIDIKNVPFAFCVWFTSATPEHVGPSIEWQPWMLKFIGDLSVDLKSTVMEVMDKSIEAFEARNYKFGPNLASSFQVQAIAEALRPDVYITKTADQRILELNKQLTEALDQQMTVMNMISGKIKAFVIQGIAGTGKTHIALAEAKKAHGRGEKTLFVCFNSLLAKYLQEQLKGYELVQVKTMHAYMKDLTESSSNPPNESWWKSELPLMAANALMKRDDLERFDTVVIDEGQDIGIQEYLDVLDLSVVGGLANGSVMVFGDFEHQGIYIPGSEALDQYKKSIPGLTVLGGLDINCRNTKEIGDTVMTFLGEESAYSKYLRSEEGTRPQIATVTENKELPNILKAHLLKLAKTYSPENVVVLSSNKELLENLVKETELPFTPVSNKQKSKYSWGTTQSFKGMESAAVVMVEFVDGNAATRDTFYVAGTRALSELVCILPQQVVQKLFS
jgi:hypothetical protein